MKITNRKYADKLSEYLINNPKSIVYNNGMILAPYPVMYYMAKATGLRTNKSRIIKKRYKQSLLVLLDEYISLKLTKTTDLDKSSSLES